MVTDTFLHPCLVTPLFIIALKPESYEGFGLSFLFGSFSLDSKEKEQFRYMTFITAY